MERTGSWKEREVGKSEMKLERLKLENSRRSCKARNEVGKFKLNLERLNEVGKLLLNLERSIEVGKSN